MTNRPRNDAAARKQKQRLKMRAWLIKKTGGKIRTAEGYVMYLMEKEQS